MSRCIYLLRKSTMGSWSNATIFTWIAICCYFTETKFQKNFFQKWNTENFSVWKVPGKVTSIFHCNFSVKKLFLLKFFLLKVFSNNSGMILLQLLWITITDVFQKTLSKKWFLLLTHTGNSGDSSKKLHYVYLPESLFKLSRTPRISGRTFLQWHIFLSFHFTSFQVFLTSSRGSNWLSFSFYLSVVTPDNSRSFTGCLQISNWHCCWKKFKTRLILSSLKLNWVHL